MKRMWSKNELKEIVKGTNKDIVTLVDSQGHNRFIEGDITPEEISGITFTYSKWSLSGSHLLIVVAGTIADTTAISSQTSIAYINLPEWIYDKLMPLFASVVVDSNNQSLTANDFTTQQVNVNLRNNNEGHPNSLLMRFGGAVTLTKERNFRFAYDFLIDNE